MFLRDAFRPFYFGGAIFAAIAVPIWIAIWGNGLFHPSLPGIYWHMHEMVYGFAAAIIIGFLFTAARNWTGLPLPMGAPLAMLFGLWVLGRLGMFFLYSPATAAVDVALLIIVASVLARKFLRVRSWCSMPLVGVLSLLAVSNAAFHAAALGWIDQSPVAIAEMGLMLVVMVEMIVGGRVVPSFTASAIPGVRQHRPAWLQRLAIGLAAAAFAADALGVARDWSGALAISAGLVVAIQAWGWNPLASRARAILWVLHLSYAWIPVGLFLLGLASLGLAPRSAAVHALSVGSMGGLIIGMMTRTALGHSGRPIHAGRAEVAMYLLVQAAAVIRVTAALAPEAHRAGVIAAGAAWGVAFAMYAGWYARVLWLPKTPTAPLPLGVRGAPGRPAGA